MVIFYCLIVYYCFLWCFWILSKSIHNMVFFLIIIRYILLEGIFISFVLLKTVSEH
jgi:hypothetical protein